MAAAALEYKETLAIEKAMLNDQSVKDKWLNQQHLSQNTSYDDEENVD